MSIKGEVRKNTSSVETVFLAKYLLAGGIAGCCAKTAVAPLDRIKILLQAHNHHYRHLGLISTIKGIQKKEGIAGLYRGNGIHMIRVFPYAAIQFACYKELKKNLRTLPFHQTHPHLCRLVNGSLAGLSAVLVTYPLDVIRARISFQVKGEQLLIGFYGTVSTIVKREGGVKALFRGMVPTLIGMVPYAGLSFYSFESLKIFLLETNPHFFGYPCNDDNVALKIPFKLLCGALAGAAAQTVVYPLDVVRRRVQLSRMLPESHKYDRHWYQIMYTVYKEEGLAKGLFRGMSINYIRCIPMQSVSFCVFELASQELGLDTGIEKLCQHFLSKMLHLQDCRAECVHMDNRVIYNHFNPAAS